MNCIGLSQQESSGSLGSGYKSVASSCDHNKEPSDSVQANEFLDQLSEDSFSKWNFFSDGNRFGLQKIRECASLNRIVQCFLFVFWIYIWWIFEWELNQSRFRRNIYSSVELNRNGHHFIFFLSKDRRNEVRKLMKPSITRMPNFVAVNVVVA